MNVGRIRELWRHPVKSMMGERIERAELGENGIPGDRAWAVRDEVRGGIRGAKKIAALMRCGARYLEEPVFGRVPPPEIRLPDGATLRASDPDAAERVSGAVEQKVTLWPLLPRTASTTTAAARRRTRTSTRRCARSSAERRTSRSPTWRPSRPSSSSSSPRRAPTSTRSRCCS
jgi:hypothetical protein